MFGKVYSKGVFRSSKGVVVYKLKNYERKNTLLGISVSKKRGNAVVRNRTRRIIKEAYRKMYARVKKGFVIVIAARQACTSYKSYEVEKELERLFDSLDLFAEWLTDYLRWSENIWKTINVPLILKFRTF